MLDKLALLQKYFDNEKLLFNVPMKNHTSFKTGGEAAAMLLPSSPEDIQRAFSFCDEHGIYCLIIGNGSNLLVSDGGIKGLVIKIAKSMNNIYLQEEDVIVAQAGCLLSEVSSFALLNSLKGFEFASGIPGSVGGAVFMNAGAYGGEMKNVLLWADAIINGNIKRFYFNELELGYRSSVFQKNGGIIISAAIKLFKGNYSQIECEMKRLNSMRREKQPLNKPSAGSTFKRPEGFFAGKLIAESGLSGYKIGGACVSEKHCGFIVNDSEASSTDIYRLIKYVQKTVYDKHGVSLEPEVMIVGDF